MSDILRINTNIRRSSGVVYNGIVFLGGQTAEDRSLDIRGQTRQALERVDKYLAEAGTDKSRLLTAQIWLKRIKDDFEGMNEVWNAWVTSGAPPTRATAQCELGHSDLLIEIIVSAAAHVF